MQSSSRKRTSIPKCWLVGCFLLHQATSVFAQGDVDLYKLSLQELVSIEVTVASRMPETTAQAPSSVSVFTHAEIRRMGVHTLEELLNFVPGFQSARTSEDGSLTNTISTRGRRTGPTTNEMLVTVDGMRINEPWTGGAIKSSNHLSLYNAKQVEIIRGPGSALYGANAFLAVVNIITDDSLMEAAVATGNFNTLETELHVSESHDDFNLSLSARSYQDEGDSYNLEQYGGLRTSDPLTAKDVQFKLSNKKLSINVRHSVREQEEFYLYGVVDNFVNNAEEEVTTARITYSIAADSSRSITIYSEYQQTSTDLELTLFPSGVAAELGFFPTGSTDKFLGGDVIETHQWLAGLDSSFTLRDVDTINFGLVYQKEFIDNAQFKSNAPIDDFFYTMNFPLEVFPGAIDSGRSHMMSEDGGRTRDINLVKSSAQRRISGAYIQYQTPFTDNLTFTTGARYDDYSDFGSNLSPRVSLVYDHQRSGATLKAIYGEAFRAPSFSERFQFDLVNPGNPDLKPEIVKTYDLVWQQRLSNIQTTITYYRSKIKDGVTLEFGSAAGFDFRTPVNTQSVTLSGIEMEAVTTVGNFLTKLAYSHQLDSDNPAHLSTDTASLILNYNFENWNININSYYHSSVEARSIQVTGVDQGGNPALVDSGRYTKLDAFWLHNLVINYTVSEATTLSFEVHNVADEEYFSYTAANLVDGGAIANRGRRLMMGVALKF